VAVSPQPQIDSKTQPLDRQADKLHPLLRKAPELRANPQLLFPVQRRAPDQEQDQGCRPRSLCLLPQIPPTRVSLRQLCDKRRSVSIHLVEPISELQRQDPIMRLLLKAVHSTPVQMIKDESSVG